MDNLVFISAGISVVVMVDDVVDWSTTTTDEIGVGGAIKVRSRLRVCVCVCVRVWACVF